MLPKPNSYQTYLAPKSLVSKFIELYNKGRLEEVFLLGEEIIKKYPKTMLIHTLLGASFSAIGNISRSCFHFAEALKLEPLNPSAYNNLGAMLIEHKNYAQAGDLLYKALLIKPNYAEAYNNLGNLMKVQNYFEKALSYFERAIKVKPDYYQAYNNLGVVQNNLKKYEMAKSRVIFVTHARQNPSRHVAVRPNPWRTAPLHYRIFSGRSSWNVEPNYLSRIAKMYRL